jgi:hypothetical protein
VSIAASYPVPVGVQEPAARRAGRHPLVTNYGRITYRATRVNLPTRRRTALMIDERAAAFTERTAESPELEPAQEQIMGDGGCHPAWA